MNQKFRRQTLIQLASVTGAVVPRVDVGRGQWKVGSSDGGSGRWAEAFHGQPVTAPRSWGLAGSHPNRRRPRTRPQKPPAFPQMWGNELRSLPASAADFLGEQGNRSTAELRESLMSGVVRFQHMKKETRVFRLHAPSFPCAKGPFPTGSHAFHASRPRQWIVFWHVIQANTEAHI